MELPYFYFTKYIIMTIWNCALQDIPTPFQLLLYVYSIHMSVHTIMLLFLQLSENVPCGIVSTSLPRLILACLCNTWVPSCLVFICV